MNDIILQMSKIKKSFFGTQVLHNVEFDLKRGEVLGLVGENGAGKSTMMNILGGVIPRDSGDMHINGKKYDPKTPKDAQNRKIAFIHQELNLFSNLTVAENIFIEDLPTSGFHNINYKYMREQTETYLKKLEVEANPNAKVEDLTMGVRQTVEITKAVMKNAEIIIFDEPTTSLSTKEKDNLFRIIESLRENGTSIIYISHILEDIMQLCDRVTVLRDGSIIHTENKCDITQNDIIRMMVGRELNQVYPTIEKKIGGLLFEAKNIKNGKMVRDASLKLNQGEILGVFGLMGAGRTEFARAVFGVDKKDGGEVIFEGEEIVKPTPQKCIEKGMAFITEDRRQEGLLMPKPIVENLILVNLGNILKRFGVVNMKTQDELATDAVEKLKIKLQDKDIQLAQSLSGGNQQKVVIGKWLMEHPKMLIMDEPTRGVDVGAKAEIYKIINSLAKNGSGILLISSEMEELIGTCDRILVMRKGEISGEVLKDDFTQENIIKYALEEGV